MPLPPVPPVMGGANPQNLEALAEAGDPRAIAILQQQQQGMPPQGMPPQGMAPPGAGAGAAPPMTPDVQASRVRQLIRMLRGQ